jgi:hypothetical protein
MAGEERGEVARRDFLKKAAVTSVGVAWATPVIQTIVASPARAGGTGAGSPPPDDGDDGGDGGGGDGGAPDPKRKHGRKRGHKNLPGGKKH